MPARDSVLIRNLPNALTLVRLALVPVFIAIFFAEGHTTPLLGALFVGAAFTDFLDGTIARRAQVLSQFGKVVDPIADRLLVNSAVVLLCIYDPRMEGHEWLVVVLRDVAAMYGIYRLRHYAIVDVSRAGKPGTALMMVGMAGLLCFRYQDGWYWAFAIGLAISVITLAVYVWRYRWVFSVEPPAPSPDAPREPVYSGATASDGGGDGTKEGRGGSPS